MPLFYFSWSSVGQLPNIMPGFLCSCRRIAADHPSPADGPETAYGVNKTMCITSQRAYNCKDRFNLLNISLQLPKKFWFLVFISFNHIWFMDKTSILNRYYDYPSSFCALLLNFSIAAVMYVNSCGHLFLIRVLRRRIPKRFNWRKWKALWSFDCPSKAWARPWMQPVNQRYFLVVVS